MLNVSLPYHHQVLAEYIKTHGIIRSKDQPIIAPNGLAQKWLIDLRPVLLNADMLDAITDLFWNQYTEHLPFQIAGMEVAAVPLVTAMLMKAKQRGIDTNGFIIRKERKTSGLGKSIEGKITDDPIILVDDIFNSGASLEKSCAIIEQAGHKVNAIFVIINYKSPKGMAWQNHRQIAVNELFDLSPFDVSFDDTSKPYDHQYTITWRFYQKGAFPFHVVPKSTPLMVEDKFYMGTDCGKMFCIHAKDGQAIWEYDVKTNHSKGIWSSPSYYKDRIYFGAYNGILYCLDAQTGAEVWKNPCCEFIGSSPLIVPDHNMLYIGLEHQRPRMMGSNAAFDLDTGARKWEVPQKKYQHGSAVYYKDIDAVIFGNADHDVSAYKAKTGETIWKHETQRSIKYAPTTDQERGQVIATSFDGHIYVLDAKTGERKAAIATNDICYTTALVTHDKIFAGSGDRHLYVIDANTLELIKAIDCRARVYSSPRLIDERVIFGTSGGQIIELHPVTLEIKAAAQLPDAVTNAVSANVTGNILYASTHMNELYAIKRERV